MAKKSLYMPLKLEQERHIIWLQEKEQEYRTFLKDKLGFESLDLLGSVMEFVSWVERKSRKEQTKDIEKIWRA